MLAHFYEVPCSNSTHVYSASTSVTTVTPVFQPHRLFPCGLNILCPCRGPACALRNPAAAAASPVPPLSFHAPLQRPGLLAVPVSSRPHAQGPSFCLSQDWKCSSRNCPPALLTCYFSRRVFPWPSPPSSHPSPSLH